MENVMYFENGIKHEFSYDEISVLRKALIQLDEKTLSKNELQAYKTLFSVVLEHLD